MDSNAFFAILLLIIGLGILAAEIFIPSGGLLGVITFISLIVSIVFAYRAWWSSHPNVFLAFCIMILLLVPTVVVIGFSILPQTTFGKRVLLDAPDAATLVPYSAETDRLQKLVGHHGLTLTLLNPGGLVQVNGERLHAVSEGLAIDPGTSVTVIAVKGTRVLVSPGSPRPQFAADDAEMPPVDEPSAMDFDFPPAT